MDISKISILGSRGYPSFYGGFETAVRKLVPYFADKGIEVTVYSRTSNKIELPPNVKVYKTKGLKNQSLNTLSHGFSGTLHSLFLKPDLVLILNSANGFFIPLLKLFNIPTLVNVDGLEWKRGKWGKLAKFAHYCGAWFTAQFAKAVITDSVEIQKYWRKHFHRNSFYIPYGGELENTNNEIIQFQQGSYILLVARFVPENSIKEFLKLIEQLNDRYLIVMVGDWQNSFYANNLEIILKNHRNLKLLGHISNDKLLHSLWENCGVYFHGHTVGGTNPALVQAMASGAPVIAHNNPFNREVLGSDYEYFFEDDIKKLAIIVDKLMSDPVKRKEISIHLKSRALTFYNWNDICLLYFNAITKTINSSNKLN